MTAPAYTTDPTSASNAPPTSAAHAQSGIFSQQVILTSYYSGQITDSHIPIPVCSATVYAPRKLSVAALNSVGHVQVDKDAHIKRGRSRIGEFWPYMDSAHVKAPATATATATESEPARKRARRPSDQFSSSFPSAVHPILLQNHHGYDDKLRNNMANTVEGLPAESSGSTAPSLVYDFQAESSGSTAPSPSPTPITFPTQQLQLGAGHSQSPAPLPQMAVSLNISHPQPNVSYSVMVSNANQQPFLLQTAISPCSVNETMAPPAAAAVTPALAFCSSASSSNRSGISPNLEQSEETSDTDDYKASSNSHTRRAEATA